LKACRNSPSFENFVQIAQIEIIPVFRTTKSSFRRRRGYSDHGAKLGDPDNQVDITYCFFALPIDPYSNRYCSDRRVAGTHIHEPQIPAPLDCLQELALVPFPDDSEVYETLRKATTALRRLRLRTGSTMFETITPMLWDLTHLELSSSWQIPGYRSIFEVVLSNGIHLESLRLKGAICWPHSPHFRNHPDALPHLRDFGLHFTAIDYRDPDLFPAISDFVRDRPHLVSLDLVAPSYCYPMCSFDGERMGLSSRAWDFLPSLPGLTRLYMIVPRGLAIQQAATLIPRSVRSLKLTGGVFQWFHSDVVVQVRPIIIVGHLRQFFVSVAAFRRRYRLA
jgi:hypothetical protein